MSSEQIGRVAQVDVDPFEQLWEQQQDRDQKALEKQAQDARITALMQKASSLEKELALYEAVEAFFQPIKSKQAKETALMQKVSTLEQEIVRYKSIELEPQLQKIEYPFSTSTQDFARKWIQKLSGLVEQLKETPNDPNLLFKIAIEQLKLQMYQQASENFDLAEQNGIDKTSCFYENKIRSFMALGKHNEAEASVRELIQLMETCTTKVRLITEALEAEGKIPSVEEIIARGGTLQTVDYRLIAEVFTAVGKADEASEYIRKARHMEF
jgi:tetratricopeptide (TPR) repeat protein